MYYLVGLYDHEVIDLNKYSPLAYDYSRKGDILTQYIIVKKGLFSVSEIITGIKIPIVKESQDIILEPIYVKNKDLNEYNIVTKEEVIDYVDGFDSEKFINLYKKKFLDSFNEKNSYKTKKIYKKIGNKAGDINGEGNN